MSKARTASRISGNCGMRSSGGASRLRLVFGIHFGAEGLFGFVEHHREMRRLLLRLHVAQELPQHVAEAEHGIDLQAVGLAVERRQRVIGAEDVARSVDQEDVVAFAAARALWRGRMFFAALGADFTADLAGMAPNVGSARGIINVCLWMAACGFAAGTGVYDAAGAASPVPAPSGKTPRPALGRQRHQNRSACASR